MNLVLPTGLDVSGDSQHVKTSCHMPITVFGKHGRQAIYSQSEQSLQAGISSFLFSPNH